MECTLHMHGTAVRMRGQQSSLAPDRGSAWLGPVSCHSLPQQQCRGMARPCCPRSLPVMCCELSGLGSWPWLAATHIWPATLAPSRTGEKTGERVRKLTGWRMDGEITYQVLLGAKQTQLREFNWLFWEKSWQTLTYLSSKFPRVHLLQALLCSLVTTARTSQSLQWGREQPEASWDRCCSRYKVASLCCTFLLTLFLCSDIVPLWAAVLLWEYLHWHGSFPESHYYVQV